MKNWLVPILALVLLPAPYTWAQGHEGGGNGDGSGYGNGKGGFGKGKPGRNSGKKGGKPAKSGQATNPRNKGSHNGRTPQGAVHQPTAPHHFTHNGGTTPNSPHNFQTSGKAFNNNLNRPGRISPRVQKMGITKLPQPLAHGKIMNTSPQQSRCEPPAQGPTGQPITAKPLEPKGANNLFVQNHMTTVTQSTGFTAQVNLYNTHETVANHYYWHTWNGANYCHYYDHWGYHWYGWYWGHTCFWSRWWGNHWWWYDPVYFHWCYWYNGWWWWQDPANMTVVYVYNNGQYVPANTVDAGTAPAASAPSDGAMDNGGGSVNPPASEGEGPSGPVAEAPKPMAPAVPIDPSTTKSFPTKDGTRTVKIISGDAFLYDTVAGETGNKPVFLASGVKQVKYSNPGNEKPLQIMLVLNDGSFELFDSDGNPYSGQSNNPGD